MKIKVARSHCKDCVWLVDGRICPFLRCVEVFGWTSDKKRSEEKIKGGRDD